MWLVPCTPTDLLPFSSNILRLCWCIYFIFYDLITCISLRSLYKLNGYWVCWVLIMSLDEKNGKTTNIFYKLILVRSGMYDFTIIKIMLHNSDASERSICSAHSAPLRNAALWNIERHKLTILWLILGFTTFTEVRSRVFYILSSIREYVSTWLRVTCKPSWSTAQAVYRDAVLRDIVKTRSLAVIYVHRQRWPDPKM